MCDFITTVTLTIHKYHCPDDILAMISRDSDFLSDYVSCGFNDSYDTFVKIISIDDVSFYYGILKNRCLFSIDIHGKWDV